MVTVNYPISQDYRHVGPAGLQPAVEVELSNGGQPVRAVAILDSGAVKSVFSLEYAQVIGIEDVTAGERFQGTSFGGNFVFYLFHVNVRFLLHGDSFIAQVGFSPATLPRNILGRDLAFTRFQIGFHEGQMKIHLLPEE